MPIWVATRSAVLEAEWIRTNLVTLGGKDITTSAKSPPDANFYFKNEIGQTFMVSVKELK
jgi:hypothetical protein